MELRLQTSLEINFILKKGGHMKTIYIIWLFILLFIAVITVSCGNIFGDNFWDDEEEWYGSETEILRIEIEPNPAIAGESVTFICFIKDSLDPKFYYLWIADIESDIQIRTETNVYKTEAPSILGNYEGNVYVSNDKPNYSAASENFLYTVIQKPN
ncbi:hypothetical protein [Rhodohalobacter halophilus]|uniref:hypothetical protein n=1 Tax=Rhodohalobacter halophilus TaxID=1812810 RepID=UPI00114CB485|nr:hypothetical protein [Rhodohalobacter halophilus]